MSFLEELSAKARPSKPGRAAVGQQLVYFKAVEPTRHPPWSDIRLCSPRACDHSVSGIIDLSHRDGFLVAASSQNR